VIKLPIQADDHTLAIVFDTLVVETGGVVLFSGGSSGIGYPGIQFWTVIT